MDWSFLAQPEFWAMIGALAAGLGGGRTHARRQIKKNPDNDFDGTNG